MAGEVDNPDEADVLEEAVLSVVGGIHTSIPGRVLSYSTAGDKPRATVRPVVRFSFIDPDTEERVPYLPEAVANVPVLFPSGSGGDYSDTWPMEAGDPVWLVIAERSIDEWLATNAADNIPQDPRRFELTDAVALPVIGAGAMASDAFDASARVIKAALLKLGSSGAIDFVALASLVDSFISTIDTVIRVAWVPAPGDGGAALKAAYTAAFSTPPSSVAATKVQAE